MPGAKIIMYYVRESHLLDTHLNWASFLLETYTKHNVDVLRVVGIPLFGIPPFKGDLYLDI